MWLVSHGGLPISTVLEIATDKHGTQGVPDTDEEMNICVHLCLSVAKIFIVIDAA